MPGCPSHSMTTMSVSVQQILSDAKKLVGRLREHDTTADGLIAHAQVLNRKVDAMKQYNEDMNELNEVARQRPRSALVLGIQQENRHIRELQQENKELRSLLEEQQSAIELIMSKYREHVMQLLMANRAERKCSKPDNRQLDLVRSQTEKIHEMAAVMAKAVSIDNAAVALEHETLVRLTTENRGLRELLDIGGRAGSVALQMGGAAAAAGVDKQIQTEFTPPPPPLHSAVVVANNPNNTIIHNNKKKNKNESVSSQGTS